VTKTDLWNHKIMSEPDLLTGLKRKEEKAIYDVYLNYYPSVEKYILMNSGTAPDAEDIFQDAVVI
jgi:DNA-directed RNA polymerase specialized sigma24 family protein